MVAQAVPGAAAINFLFSLQYISLPSDIIRNGHPIPENTVGYCHYPFDRNRIIYAAEVIW